MNIAKYDKNDADWQNELKKPASEYIDELKIRRYLIMTHEEYINLDPIKKLFWIYYIQAEQKRIKNLNKGFGK